MARSRKKLGEILVGWGVITADQAEKAATLARGSGKRLGDALVEAGFAKEDQIAKALANQFGMEFVDLAAHGVADKSDPTPIPGDLVRKHPPLPISQHGHRPQHRLHHPTH